MGQLNLRVGLFKVPRYDVSFHSLITPRFRCKEYGKLWEDRVLRWHIYNGKLLR